MGLLYIYIYIYIYVYLVPSGDTPPFCLWKSHARNNSMPVVSIIGTKEAKEKPIDSL